MNYNICTIFSKLNPSRFNDDDDLEKVKKDLEKFPITFPVKVENYGVIEIKLECFLKEDFDFSFIPDGLKNFQKDDNLFLKYSFNLNTDISDQELSILIWRITTKKISEFSIALQIALPGFVHFSAGLVFVNDKFDFETVPLFTLCQEMDSVIISKIGWPKLELMEPIIVWNWLEKYFDGFENFSSSRTQRAVFSFTQIFDDLQNDSHIDFIWGMIGLEALFAQDKNGIQQQLNEKIQVILGDLKDFKKIIKQLYNYRSKFLHGDLDIPSKFQADEMFDKKLDFIFKYEEMKSLAIAILIASFQYMVKNNVNEINFKYEII